VEDGALDDALETERGLGIDLVGAATVGVCAVMKSPSAFLSSSMFAAHARSTSAAVGCPAARAAGARR